MYQTKYNLAPHGWICPKCGRVYSPSTVMCSYCGENTDPSTATSAGTAILNDKGWWESYLKQTTADTVGGSDYWSTTTHTWVNVPTTLTNNKEKEV